MTTPNITCSFMMIIDDPLQGFSKLTIEDQGHWYEYDMALVGMSHTGSPLPDLITPLI